MRLLLLLLTLIPQMLFAGVNVTISNGIDDGAVKSKIERTISSILTEANAAQSAGRELNFKGMSIPTGVQESLSMLWENCPFVCSDEEIVENCLNTGTGYQVRNIPLMMRPADQNFNEDEYQEAVASFTRNGELESFYLTISTNQYLKIIRSNLELTDLRRRQLILDYVERFRTSYNQKDIKFLDQIFSDDALIITGKVISRSTDNINLPPKVEYYKRSKQQYLANLKKQFANNKYIKVTFDDVEVSRSTDENVYGVTLRQGYSVGNYHDDGYVFLVWDFSNEKAPKIFVRTWQPSKFDDGRDFPKDEVFNLNDFDF